MRYLLGFLVTVGLIILIVFLLLTGGSKQGTAPKVLKLSDYTYSATAEADYLVDGPIVANQDHNTLEVKVTQSQITAIVYQGYDKNAIKTQTYPNNPDSFAVFMRALDHAGFTRGDTSKSLTDERGICPSGQRTIYQLTDGTTNLMRFWHASCGQGTFKGMMSDVAYLFRQQIPQADMSQLTQNLGISF